MADSGSDDRSVVVARQKRRRVGSKREWQTIDKVADGLDSTEKERQISALIAWYADKWWRDVLHGIVLTTAEHRCLEPATGWNCWAPVLPATGGAPDQGLEGAISRPLNDG